jgi:hypothetical protein
MVQDRITLKTYFETFDTPTEGEFGDLIDSMILKGDSYNMEVVVPYIGDYSLTPPTTSGNNFNTTLSLSQKPVINTGVDVIVNGVSVSVGNGTNLGVACYFSRDGGITAIFFSDLQIGDILYWNGTEAGYQIGAAYNVDFQYVRLLPTVVNFGSLEPVEKTGTVITYDGNAIYGSPSVPESSSITDSMVSAKKGFEQKIYHTNGVVPAFPAHWVKMTANTYSTSTLNTIKAVLTVGGRVEYEILQDN